MLLLPITVMAQWTSRPSFRDVKAWHEYGGGVFCRCAHGAFAVDSDGEIVTFTKSSGLSSADLTASTAEPDGKFWALGYGDGRVDVCKGRRIVRLESPSLSPGAVTDMDCNANIIVAATEGGVMLIDVERMEMSAFCTFNSSANRVALIDGVVYAASGDDVFAMEVGSHNFQDFGAWHEANGFSFDNKPKYDGATPKGMPEDSVAAITVADGKLLTANNYCTQITRQNVESFVNPDNQKFTAAFYNPYNSSQYFLGGSDGTLYEYVGNTLKSTYDNLKGAPIVGMDCNSSGDLFILSASVDKPVSVFDHNGNWHGATSFQSMKCTAPTQIIFVNDNLVFVNTGVQGIYAVDLGGTPLDFSDDKYVVCQVVSGGVRVGTEITAMRLSQSGRLYVGTDKGVAYATNPETAVDGGINFFRPVITETSDRDGDYSQYLLSSKSITSIAEDAAGRKWIATNGAGVFVVADDCNSEVMRFNTRNSPLPSDTVYRVEIVQNTGEVFFSTRCGLASYISDAQKSAADLDNILVYPNPVRPDYHGDIHISGLEAGSDVRITDVAGHLVYKSVTDSGLLIWDGNNLNGRRCATGVYLIFVYNTESGDKKVKKILIVR